MNQKNTALQPVANASNSGPADRVTVASGNWQPLSQQQRVLRSYLLLAYTQRTLILGVAAAVLVLAALKALLATPMYRADATVRIGTYTPAMSGIAREDYVAQQTRELDYLNTQIELLTSLGVTDAVLSQNSEFKEALDRYYRKYDGPGLLTRLRELAGGKTKQEALDSSYQFSLEELQKYTALLAVRPIRKTSLVRVSATAADPELAAQIANLHSEHYIQYVRNEREKGALENLVFLKNQAAELADKVAVSERRLAAYAEANAIIAVNKDENIVVERMAELNRLFTEAGNERIKSEAAWKEAAAGTGLSGQLAADQAFQQLTVNLKAAEGEASSLAQKFQPAYPRMAELSAKVAALKQAVAQRRAEIARELESQYRADLQSENLLREQLETQKSKAFDLSKREVQHNTLKREFESVKDLHQSVLRQLKEAQLSAEQQTSNISLVERAAVPSRHVSPQRTLIMILALIFGPLIGFGTALLVNALDNTIKTGEEISELIQLPVLGVVPDFERSARLALPHAPSLKALPAGADAIDQGANGLIAAPSRENRAELVALSAPNSITSEVFRTIRTSVLLSSAQDAKARVLLVTSAKKGEGKTVLSTNLAVTLSQAGYRVVIVDCDLRRPAVHRYFGAQAADRGLVDVIVGHCGINDVIKDTQAPNLKLIVSGQTPPNPAELIGSEKMRGMLAELAARFDYVIVDSPPVLPVTDSAILSRMVDGVLLIARAESTPRPLIRDAAGRLRQVGARMLGVILNSANTEGGNYYYYRHAYSYYYDNDLPTLREALRGLFRPRKPNA